MITARQCKMARGALDLSLRQVAEAVGVNINTIIRFEAGGDPRSSIRDKIEQVFTEAGLVLHGDGRTVTDTRTAEPSAKAA
jgi:transcriptional regulator with XRE-family HTH domain